MVEARRFPGLVGVHCDWVLRIHRQSPPWESFVAKSWVRSLNRILQRQRHPVCRASLFVHTGPAQGKAGRDGALESNSAPGRLAGLPRTLNPLCLPLGALNSGCQKVALPGPINASRPLRAWPTGPRSATPTAAAQKDLQPKRYRLSRLPSYSAVSLREGCESRRDFAQRKSRRS